jgi:hypothetical protein
VWQLRTAWGGTLALAIMAAGCSQSGHSSVVPGTLAQSQATSHPARRMSSVTGASTLCTIDPNAECYQVVIGQTLTFSINYQTNLCGASELLSFLDSAASEYNFTTTVTPLYVSPPSTSQCNFGTYQVEATYTVATTQNTTATEIAGGFTLYNTNSSPAPPGGNYINFFATPPADAVDIVFIQSSPSPTPSPSASPWQECWPIGFVLGSDALLKSHSRFTPRSATAGQKARPAAYGYTVVACASASPPTTPTPSPGQTPIPTPTPGLVIYDTAIQNYGTSQVISSDVAPAPSPLMVGQEVLLQVAASSPYTSLPASITWTFASGDPTDVVANYNLSPSLPPPSALPSPESVASAGYTATGGGPVNAPVYWVKKGTKSVSVNATVAGQSVAASVEYPIHAPTVTTVTQTVYDNTYIGTVMLARFGGELQIRHQAAWLIRRSNSAGETLPMAVCRRCGL